MLEWWAGWRLKPADTVVCSNRPNTSPITLLSRNGNVRRSPREEGLSMLGAVVTFDGRSAADTKE
eukprot:645913-Lingulodinium_polyedra.AAC.1